MLRLYSDWILGCMYASLRLSLFQVLSMTVCRNLYGVRLHPSIKSERYDSAPQRVCLTKRYPAGLRARF